MAFINYLYPGSEAPRLVEAITFLNVFIIYAQLKFEIYIHSIYNISVVYIWYILYVCMLYALCCM